ncbi:MAG: SpoVG family protein [Candidatus Oleimicrobiaceae bacterium]
MEITEVAITLREEERLKAFVNVTFDNVFVVRGMKVIHGNTGYFVSMPSRKAEDGTYRDIAHPVTPEFREYLEKTVLAVYRKKLMEEKGLTEEQLPPELR